MDWSLLQPHANRKYLREVRGFKNPYWYYLAMCIDPILRFNWIFYSIYTHDLQHSTLVSFLVGLSEVTRRGMWTLFRVENEHCSNVVLFKASRDVPLPYVLETGSQESLTGTQQGPTPEEAEITQPSVSPTLSRYRSRTSSASLEPPGSPSALSMRRRLQPIRRFTKMLADAHRQDFEKKRKPGAGDSDNVQNLRRDGSLDEDGRGGSSDEDDDSEQIEQDILDAEDLRRRERQEEGRREN
jgi:hypothetical protein